MKALTLFPGLKHYTGRHTSAVAFLGARTGCGLHAVATTLLLGEAAPFSVPLVVLEAAGDGNGEDRER